MSYTLGIAWNGVDAGIADDLRVQLRDADGTPNGSPQSGAVEDTLVAGSYRTEVTVPDGFRGYAVLYQVDGVGDPLVGFAVAAIERTQVDGYELWELLAIVAAAAAGKTSGFMKAQAAAPGVFRSVDDAADRISATTDANANRTAVVITPPA